jgi:intein/homing endonuclease
MASGTTKKISEINQDELVWNPVLKKGVRVLHSTVGEELNPLIVFTVGKHRIRVTEKHPMMTDVGHIAAEKLKLGDKLLLANGRYGVIDSISADASRKGEHVWNLVLDNGPDGLPQPNFIADGFVVGDWKMQQALEWNLLKH